MRRFDINSERKCKNPMCACTGECWTTNIPKPKYIQTQVVAPNISCSLKLCRKLKGLSLRDVEEKTGISNAYLSQLETGKIKEPSFSIVIKLCKFYNITIDDLLES